MMVTILRYKLKLNLAGFRKRLRFARSTDGPRTFWTTWRTWTTPCSRRTSSITMRLGARCCLNHCVQETGAFLISAAGIGVLGQRLIERGFDVFGTEYSANMLNKALERGVKGALLQNGQIPFGDKQFDLVYSVAVFHHLETKENVRRAIREMVRVTKPGGEIVIWDHNPLNPLWPALMKRWPQDHGDERLVLGGRDLRWTEKGADRERPLLAKRLDARVHPCSGNATHESGGMATRARSSCQTLLRAQRGICQENVEAVQRPMEHLGTRITYVPQRELTQTSSPRVEWVIAISPLPCGKPASRVTLPSSETYSLWRAYQAYGPSGFCWFVYRRAASPLR